MSDIVIRNPGQLDPEQFDYLLEMVEKILGKFKFDQNLDLKIRTDDKKFIAIQNINIGSRKPSDNENGNGRDLLIQDYPTQEKLYALIIDEVIKAGGLKVFTDMLCQKAVEHFGTKTEAMVRFGFSKPGFYRKLHRWRERQNENKNNSD